MYKSTETSVRSIISELGGICAVNFNSQTQLINSDHGKACVIYFSILCIYEKMLEFDIRITSL